MKRSRTITFSGAVLAAVLASACAVGDVDDDDYGSGGGGDEYAELCMDSATEIIVDDDRCESGSGGHRWIYYPIGAVLPVIGAKAIKGYALSAPAGSTITRGGFGGRVVGGS
ncbi:MAG: hypothetical protein HOV79_12575 [Hamadaea sp.]|nr:hypothetical protein [Hamadaea sp.]